MVSMAAMRIFVSRGALAIVEGVRTDRFLRERAILSTRWHGSPMPL